MVTPGCRWVVSCGQQDFVVVLPVYNPTYQGPGLWTTTAMFQHALSMFMNCATFLKGSYVSTMVFT